MAALAASSSSAISSKGPHGNHRGPEQQQQQQQFHRTMRRWNRWLKAIGILVVATQLSTIGIAIRNLEHPSELGPAHIELFGTSRHQMVAPTPNFGTPTQRLEPNLRQRHRIPPSPKPHHNHHLESRASPNQHQQPQLAQHPQPPPRELIHIVHTRFMQHQGNLTTLGVARLHQFVTFCLPTMVQQTTQDFLWIIKVDPLLEDFAASRQRVLEPLLEAISASGQPNIYVVASNYNFNVEGHGGSWRDGQEGEELLPNSTARKTGVHWGTLPPQAKVFTGNITLLQRAYDLREALPVLETRLDADDGLHRNYLEKVQAIALDRFLGPIPTEHHVDEATHSVGSFHQINTSLPALPKPQWLYWCIMTQIEWHSERYSNPNTKNNTHGGEAVANANSSTTTPDYWEIRNQAKHYYGNPQKGYVVPLNNENFCITPGLTVGYGVGMVNTQTTVPRYMHTNLFPKLHNRYKLCHAAKDKHSKKGPCLERMGGAETTADGRTTYIMDALRSRTLTSAGMDGVGNSDSDTGNDNGNGNHEPNPKNSSAPVATHHAEEPSNTDQKMERILWKVVEQHFGIDVQAVRTTQAFLREHRVQIALENSLGQCSNGHSCKEKAREQLQKIVESHRQQQQQQQQQQERGQNSTIEARVQQ